MTAARSRAQLGKSVLERSKADERAVAAYLREIGLYPHAERAVRTGFKAIGERGADPGDICNTPGAIFSVKSVEDLSEVDRSVPKWLDELDKMRTGDLDPVRLLVTHRFGKSSPADWWCHMWAFQFAEMSGARPEAEDMVGLAFPVRTLFGNVIPLLLAARPVAA